MKTMRVMMVCVLAGAMGATAVAQGPESAQRHSDNKERDQIGRQNAGDEPDNPGPLAKLSPALKPKDVEKAVTMVADWQVKTAQAKFDDLWTYAALYDGLLAASEATGNPKYHDAVLHMAEDFQWKLYTERWPNADDLAVGKAYMYLDLVHPSPERVAAVKDFCDKLVARPDDPKKLLYWWADSLYMGPAVMARLSKATGDRKYIDYMDHEWWLNIDALYNKDEHLEARDGRYVKGKFEANGRPVFWSRGVGWVVAGTAMVLDAMPQDYPSRPKYVELYREMMYKLLQIQSKDGLWRPGLLDADAYKLPELSGSAFFTYAMAWGINNGTLDRATYTPAVEKAWAGMLKHVYADGRLGSIQPIGFQPDGYKEQSSSVFGVGAFLLAGNEVEKMAKRKR